MCVPLWSSGADMADCWQCWKTLGYEFILGNVEVWHVEGCQGRSLPSAWCAAEEFKSERGGGLKATVPADAFIVWRLREYVRSVLLPLILSFCLPFVCCSCSHFLLSFTLTKIINATLLFCHHFSWAELKDLRLFLCTKQAYFSQILFTNLSKSVLVSTSLLLR